jgi:hypothetical protein
MQEFLFNPALWIPVAALAAAIGVFIYGNNRVKPAIRNAGVGLVGLVLVWAVAAYLVQTRVEQCVTRTHAILAAVEAADWTQLRALLDKNTTLSFLPGGGGDAIRQAAQNSAEAYGLKDIRTLRTTAEQRALEGVDVTIDTLLEGAQPLNATFRFEYEQRSDGILLAKIVPITIGRISEEQMRSAIR